MMSEHLQAIFAKKPEDISVTDKADVQEALRAYWLDLQPVNEKHGFQIAAKIQVTENGIVPFTIPVPIVVEQAETKE